MSGTTEGLGAMVKVFAIFAIIGFAVSGLVIGYKTGMYLFELLVKLIESSF